MLERISNIQGSLYKHCRSVWEYFCWLFPHSKQININTKYKFYEVAQTKFTTQFFLQYFLHVHLEFYKVAQIRTKLENLQTLRFEVCAHFNSFPSSPLLRIVTITSKGPMKTLKSFTYDFRIQHDYMQDLLTTVLTKLTKV